MENPKISVIIPVFNQEKFIERCINSVLDQTLKDFEILVIDDGSTDGTYAILESYGKNLNVFKSRNAGPGGARNVGLDNAKGEYVFFLDSDDWITYPDTLELLYEYSKKNDLDILIYDFFVVEKSGLKKKLILNFMEYGKLYNGTVLLDLFLLGHMSKFPWDKFYKYELIKKINYRFPEKVWFEDIFQVILLAAADKVIKIDYTPYSYWQGNTSITRSFTNRIYDREKVCLFTISELNKKKLLDNKHVLVEVFFCRVLILNQVFDAIDKGKYKDLAMMVNQVNKKEDLIKFSNLYKNNIHLSFKEKLYLFLIFNKLIPILYCKKYFSWLKSK